MLRGNQWTVAPCATPSQVDLRDSHTWRKPRAEVLLLLFSSLDEERRELGLESSCTAKRCVCVGGRRGGQRLRALEPECGDIHFRALLELGYRLCQAREMCQ